MNGDATWRPRSLHYNASPKPRKNVQADFGPANDRPTPAISGESRGRPRPFASVRRCRAQTSGDCSIARRRTAAHFGTVTLSDAVRTPNTCQRQRHPGDSVGTSDIEAALAVLERYVDSAATP